MRISDWSSDVCSSDLVFAKLGTAEVATDPMPPSVADTYIIMKDREDWPDPRKPKTELVREMDAAVRAIPGNNYEFTQPVQMRMNELIAGVRAEVAIKVFGDDLDTLVNLGEQVEPVAAGLAGAAVAKMAAYPSLPLLTSHPLRRPAW